MRLESQAQTTKATIKDYFPQLRPSGLNFSKNVMKRRSPRNLRRLSTMTDLTTQVRTDFTTTNATTNHQTSYTNLVVKSPMTDFLSQTQQSKLFGKRSGSMNDLHISAYVKTQGGGDHQPDQNFTNQSKASEVRPNKLFYRLLGDRSPQYFRFRLKSEKRKSRRHSQSMTNSQQYLQRSPVNHNNSSPYQSQREESSSPDHQNQEQS